jgi:aspartyl-tRNA synthetase
MVNNNMTDKASTLTSGPVMPESPVMSEISFPDFQRSHYCGDVTIADVGASSGGSGSSGGAGNIKLYGWVNRIRNHGKLIFIDLRDRAGIVQVVVNDNTPELFALAAKIHNEYVIHVQGVVQARPAGLINKDMRTGEIEVAATHLEIINRSEALPFNLDDHSEANEELKLRYRYLDLRRPEMAARIMARAKVVRLIREYFDTNGFIEIETPILTKSTPEGARDYLVPSRNFPGQFYALPQSPQIFKQLLMAAGMDRYYQIARCFRDEDLRADRQPEFTQLDLEMSFTSERQIQDMVDGMFKKLFAEILHVDLPLPLPRMTYAEAMSKYGSDKPDLRIPLEIVEIKDVFIGDGSGSSDCGFFAAVAQDADSRIAVLRLPQGVAKLSRKLIDGYTELTKSYGAKGLGYIKVNDLSQGAAGWQTSLKFLSASVVEQIVRRAAAENGDMIFLLADKSKVVSEALGALRLKLGHDHNLVAEGWRFAWVTDFPMFEQKDDGSWTFLHHPFTASKVRSADELRRNPQNVVARAYDLVLNGTELGGGSIRIHDLEMQLAVLEMIGVSHEMAQQQFGHLLDSFKYGYPPEGGVAFGVDRIAMLLAGGKSLRDVLAFPKTQTASCPLTQAPSPVSPVQLKELGISIATAEHKEI